MGILGIPAPSALLPFCPSALLPFCPSALPQSCVGSVRAPSARTPTQDCELCNLLAAKLEILANNAGMANVCVVPLSFIFMRGQGVKIFSLVAKRCRDDGLLIPTRKAGMLSPDEEEEDEEGYEGAIVLEPQVTFSLGARERAKLAPSDPSKSLTKIPGCTSRAFARVQGRGSPPPLPRDKRLAILVKLLHGSKGGAHPRPCPRDKRLACTSTTPSRCSTTTRCTRRR